eukprot:GFUD01013352.1.p1 GENE.GFUD01013352.1~~GFUD01013352.1.p1  ORF type:complete len:1191 (+),score=213.83 GFUD01013352.1:87-3659(+)
MAGERKMKIIVIGDQQCGKSAMIDCFIGEKEENFHLTHEVTTVLDMKSKVLNVANKNIVLHIWDVGGSVIDQNLRERVAYINAELAIIAFSKTDTESLENVKVKWEKEVRKCLPDVPIILVGTKKDEITDEAREATTGKVITSAGSKVASMIKAKDFIECSSLLNENVQDVFEKGVKLVIDQRKKMAMEERKMSKKMSKVSSRSFDETIIQETELELFEDFLGASYDHECLTFLQNQNASSLKQINHQLSSLDTSLLYILCQRCFAKSLKFLLNAFPTEATVMLVKIDKSQRTPIMVSDDISIFNIVNNFMNEKGINQAYGKDSEETDIPLVLLYIQFNFENLAKGIIESVSSDERTMFLNLKDKEDNSVLLKGETSELLGNFIIENYIDDLDITATNQIGKNVAHIFSKKGYKVSHILSKINKETTFKLLSQQDWHGNTPLMACARYGNQAALACFLTFYFDLSVSRNTKDEDVSKVDKMVHLQNNEGHNLTYLVFIHKQELQSSYGTILELEKHVHNHFEKSNDEDVSEEIGEDERKIQGMQKYLKCLRESQISKMEIKSIKNVLDENEAGSKFIVLLVLSLGSFWFPLGTYTMDVSTDSLLTKDYYQNWMHQDDPNSTTSICNLNSTQLTDYPQCLDPFYKFVYSSVFMGLPWLFYFYEFVTSEIFRILIETCRREGDLAWMNLQNQSIGRSFLISYMKASAATILLPLVFLTWPVFTKLVHFYYIAKYRTSTEDKKSEFEDKMWNYALIAARAHILEVCIESSFQPLLQWYQLFPGFLIWCLNLNTREFNIQQYSEEVDSLKIVFSLVSSIFSLGWSFSVYKVAKKRGTLDMGSNPIGRIVLFLSNLFLILARLQSFVIFSYFFGPGNFYPIIAFISGHIILISVLHGMFSEVSVLMKSNKKRLVTICLINGLSNIFLHNYIDLDDLAKDKEEETVRWKATLARQLLFDFIFIVENLILAFIGSMNDQIDIPQKEETFHFLIITIFCCHFLGLIFKFIYYKKLHAWSFLTESSRRKGNGLSFEFKYLFCNNIRTFNIYLPYACLVPNIIKLFLNELKKQLIQNILRQGGKGKKSGNTMLSCVVGMLSIPIYILLILLGLVLFLVAFVFLIVALPVFLFGRLIFCCESCTSKTIQENTKEVESECLSSESSSRVICETTRKQEPKENVIPEEKAEDPEEIHQLLNKV